MTNQKTFKDLKFEIHNNVTNGIQANLDLGNGILISVVSMLGERPLGGLYGNVHEGTYEVAVFHNNSMLPLSEYDDVVGWQTVDEITVLMSELQGKPEDIHAFISQLHIAKEDADKELYAWLITQKMGEY